MILGIRVDVNRILTCADLEDFVGLRGRPADNVFESSSERRRPYGPPSKRGVGTDISKKL